MNVGSGSPASDSRVDRMDQAHAAMLDQQSSTSEKTNQMNAESNILKKLSAAVENAVNNIK
ncbi:MAG: hypothetical protein HWE34_17655 [Methylocystaceae bacterium]|nr:hypothetical protein [Methylocystaceae bacterium]